MKLNPKKLLAVLLAVMVITEMVVSVMLGTVADVAAGNKAVTKSLLDFSQTTEAKDIKDSAWPTGISKMTADDKFAYNSSGTVDIAVNDSGEKYLKFNMDKKAEVSKSNDEIVDRTSGHKFFLKVSVPALYIQYVTDIKVDYLYNYKKASGNDTDNQNNIFYILGINDGTTWGKSVRTHKTIAPTNAVTVEGSMEETITSMKRLVSGAVDTFDKTTTGYVNSAEWTAQDISETNSLDIVIMVSAPTITNAIRNKGYFFGIKDVKITIEGPEEEIDNIDNPNYVDSHIVNFEEGSTLAEIQAATSFVAQARGELVTNDAHSGTNSYLYRRKMLNNGSAGVDYDTRVRFSIDKKNSSRGEGITFMVKNISDVKVTFRLWIAAGNAVDDGQNLYASRGKYQYTFEVQPDMTEFKRITVFWDNVGLTNFNGSVGGFSGGTSSGTSIPQSEIDSGLNFTLLQSGMNYDAAGVLFDTFELVTPEFTKSCEATIADFENSDVGTNDIPSNITIGGTYHGSAEIVEDINGDKGLQLNYDMEQTTFSNSAADGHHLSKRPYFQISISVPKGVLDGATSIIYDVRSNRTNNDPGVFDRTNSIYTRIAYVAGFSAGSDYGKNGETRIEIDWAGDNTISLIPTSLMHSSSGGMVSYLNKATTTKWTEEELSEIDTLHFYVSAPYTEGNGTDESFVIKNISIKYNEPHNYEEGSTRAIFQTTKSETVVGTTLKVTDTAVKPIDPNIAEFDKVHKLEVSEGNTEGALFTNDMTAYHRNLKPFVESAIFHLFTKVEKVTELQLTLTDRNGASLSYNFNAEPTTAKLYSEVSLNFKDIYDAYILNNPEAPFDFTDIKTLSITPVNADNATIYLAKPEILTGAYVSSAQDPEKLKNVNLINFDNMDTVDELPLGLKVNNGFGTLKLVEKEDGSKALRIYYDAPLTINRAIAYGQLHQIVSRTINSFTVTVPSGSLKGLKNIKFTVNANVPAFDDNNRYANTYYQTVVHGNGSYFKANQSALKYTQAIGYENVVDFNLYAGATVGGGSASGMANWLNPEGALKVDDNYAEGFTTIYITVGVPECTGQEGYWFELSSIDLVFDAEPAYNETESRTIIDGDRLGKVSSNKIKVTEQKIESNDKNYRKFKKSYLLNAQKNNAEAVLFENGNINFLRNAKTFVETANFRMYAHSDVKTTAKLAFVNFNGERLPFEVEISKTKDDVFDEYIVPLKQIYEEYFAANPNAKFSLNNLTGIEILPDTSSAVKFRVAEVSLWTGKPGSGSSAGNYYNSNDADTVRIEGYLDAIPETFTSEILVYNNPVAEIQKQEIRIPVGTTPIAMAKFTLKNNMGEIAEPTNNFWISFKVPAGTDMSDIGIYRVFLDGSLVKLRHAIEPDNFITANTFFSMDTFVVLSGVKSSVADNETEDTTEEIIEEEYEEIYEQIEEDDTDNNKVITTPSRVVRKKKILKKKNVQSNDFTWLWILLAVIAVVVIAVTGIIIFIIVRKKRKNGKENIA